MLPTTELILCAIALLLGPAVNVLTHSRKSAYALVDGFVLVGVGGLVLFEILPRTFTVIGVWAAPLAVFGFFFPHLLEHRLNSLPVSPRTILSSLIILGLAIHQLLDGAALAHTREEGHLEPLTTLGLAIILHQVPKGFLLWEIARKAGGVSAAAVVIIGLLATTALGFVLGDSILRVAEAETVSAFQSFVAGGLLHVVVHHVSGGVEGKPGSRLALWSGIGALSAATLFALLPHSHLVDAHELEGGSFRTKLLELGLESAPAILLGFLAAGALHAFVPLASLRLLRGSNALSSALRGIILGLPLPICSCGVTPLYHTLLKRGAPAAAAIAFLIATPEIGLDSFFLSWRLLGLETTLARLAVAFAVAVITALALSASYSRASQPQAGEIPDTDEHPVRSQSQSRPREALRYAGVELVDHLGAWLLAGLLIAAIAEPLLDPEWFAELPVGLEVPLLALVGLPIYVCASGATPLAAVLLAKGVSTGAAIAFLITGPTTNITTFGILARLHGTKKALLLPLTVLAASVAAGWTVNLVPGLAHPLGPRETSHAHGTLEWAALAALLLLLGASILRNGPRHFLVSLLGGAGLEEVEPGATASPRAAHGHGHDHNHGHAHAHGHSHDHAHPDPGSGAGRAEAGGSSAGHSPGRGAV